MSFEQDFCENSLENVSLVSESSNSRITNPYLSIEKEMINTQLIVLEPNNPVMDKIQNTLKQYLLKQKERIKLELTSLQGPIKSKQHDNNSSILDSNRLKCQIESQRNLLNEFHRMKNELEKTNKLVETSINEGKQRYTEIVLKTSVEKEKLADLKRRVDGSRELLNELKKYEKEQKITFNMCNQKKSETQQYKKKLLNDQQRQDLLLSSLTQEILRLEDRMKQLDEQAETKYNESELFKQKVMDSSTDLDAINRNITKITLSLNEQMSNIQQFDDYFQKKKNELQEEKTKYHALLIEATSYKSSAQNQMNKKYNRHNFLIKLKQKQNNLQSNLIMCSNKLDGMKDELSKLEQIIEFEQQNLNQDMIDQKSIKNEINKSLNLLDTTRNTKLKYEEDIFDVLKKQLFSSKNRVQISNKISELKDQNKEHELMLVEVENNLAQALFKLEQYRTTSTNLEKDIEENNKFMNNHELVLSAMNSELRKLLTDIQYKSRNIDKENKHLETLQKKCDEGFTTSIQMQIDQVKQTTDEIRKETYTIKQTWIQKQTKHIQLLDEQNKKINEIYEFCKCVSLLKKKYAKLEQEIDVLSKEIDERTLTKMRNTIVKLNEDFNKNKGKNSQLLNENEWIQCSYLDELKESEKQNLEYIDRLKLLKNELNEMKNLYIEKHRESKSWDSKIQSLVEMKKEMKNKEGDAGDIDAIKKEIRRMEIKQNQLKKISEKIMSDIEICLSKREMIYDKVSTKNTRLKGKIEAKQKLSKKINNLRVDIKKFKIENNKLDRNMCDLLHKKMEMESKLTYMNEQLDLVQTNNNDLMRKIKDTGTTKIKNIYYISYKQTYARFLEEVKRGNYNSRVKSGSKMKEEFAAESKKNSDLISVVEALKNDFPYLGHQIIRLLSILEAQID